MSPGAQEMPNKRSRVALIKPSGVRGILLLNAEAVKLLSQDGEKWLWAIKDKESGLVSLQPILTPKGAAGIASIRKHDGVHAWSPRITSRMLLKLLNGKDHSMVWNDQLSRAELVPTVDAGT